MSLLPASSFPSSEPVVPPWKGRGHTLPPSLLQRKEAQAWVTGPSLGSLQREADDSRKGQGVAVPSFHNPITPEVGQRVSPFLKPCAEHESFLRFLKLQELHGVLTVPTAKCLKNFSLPACTKGETEAQTCDCVR